MHSISSKNAFKKINIFNLLFYLSLKKKKQKLYTMFYLKVYDVT